MNKEHANKLWNRLEKEMLITSPENYTANIKLIKDLLTYKHIVHPTAVASSYFTIVSGLTAESFYTHHYSSTTLYTISIAGTGTGKDMAVDIIPQIFDAIKNRNLSTKTDIGYEVITSKITSVGALDGIFKNKRMIIYVLDEFGDALGKMQGGGHAGELTAKFKELYSLTNKTYKSIVYSRSNKNSGDNIKRDYPCFILSGLTTKEQLLTRLKRSMLHDGFLNRFVIMDGSDLHPYIDNDFNHSSNNQFEDVINFYEKVKHYPNTPINMTYEAKEYYKSIGSPYEEGTDIHKFCTENLEEDFETNASTSNRWRENALRLATAITAYEYGVNSSSSDIYKFQSESFNERKELLKGTPLEKFKGAKDLVQESINKLKQQAKNTDKAYELTYIQQVIDGYETNREFYNKLLNSAQTDGHISYISNLTEQLLGVGDESIINKSIESAKDELLNEALEKIFEGVDIGNKQNVLDQILANKSPAAQQKINTLLTSNVNYSNNTNNSPFTAPVFVEKDILEWAYNFIKAQSIKFYEIFHTEVGQSQHTIKKSKLIKWFKENHYEADPWHTQSELARTYVFNKLCSLKEREEILNDLLDSGTIEVEIIDSNRTHKPTKRYRLLTL